ncbi:MAG: A/G-specific adenine glycosylase [Dysgonamonadaceae bacterium]|jgi:A/G-specific adenine glycosylase|nr:A/G-specific adenine glycosylase [Dysgonamonadaceae bacterium]
MENYRFVREKILDWYEIHKRILPWRGITDPYKIWISEVILQQTRVAQGLEYYKRFIERFPDVHALAVADEQEVLKYWQGLGYYSRARNLHAAARSIETRFGGKFPQNYQLILSLQGIGEYTAAAVASFAFNLPYPVVDGNVFRFLSRLFVIEEPIDTSKGKKLFTELAGQLMDKHQAGLFNQAIMEFGALQCVPVSPDCGECPLAAHCLAKMQGKVSEFPVKQNKTKTKELYLYYFYIHSGESIFLKKREGKGIWQNLYEFPSVESEIPLEFEDLIKRKDFQALFPEKNATGFKLLMKNYKHVLTHRILYAGFYEVFVENESALGKYKKIMQNEIGEYPIHRLMQLFLEKNCH